MCHAGAQHSAQTALAFQEAGALAFYATGIYGGEKCFPGNLARVLPGRLRRSVEALCSRRRLPGLDEDLVTTDPLAEGILAVAIRTPLVRRMTPTVERWRVRSFARRLARRLAGDVDVVIAYGADGAYVFAAVEGGGVRCVLDQQMAHWRHQAESLEREADLHPQFAGDQARHRAARARRVGPRWDQAFGMADQVLIGSSFAAATLIGAGVDPGRVSVVPYGATPPADLPPRTTDRRTVRVLYAGSIEVHKGIYYLLEAIKRIGNRRVELVMVGRLELPAPCLAPYAGLFRHVDHVPRAELWSLYRSSDVFVFPSLGDGFGLVLAEAATAGLPIVSTTCSGGPDVVRDGETGFLVPPCDAEALADRIDALADDAALRCEMAHRAQEVARRFTWEQYRKKVVRAVLGVPVAHSGSAATAADRRGAESRHQQNRRAS